jgi:RNA polymerase sigma-70 factor (ECF subfamily)
VESGLRLVKEGVWFDPALPVRSCPALGSPPGDTRLGKGRAFGGGFGTRRAFEKKSQRCLSKKGGGCGWCVMSGAESHVYEQFVRLLSAHEGRLKAFLRSFLPRWEDVEEAVQETSIVAWKKFSQFDPASDFGAWLLTIGRFEALKVRRAVFGDRLVFREALWEAVLDEGMEEAQRLEGERRALEGCLRKLEPRQREWLAAAYQPGVKAHEVAAASGRSPVAFYKTLQRLRALLLECMQQQFEQEGTR